MSRPSVVPRLLGLLLLLGPIDAAAFTKVAPARAPRAADQVAGGGNLVAVLKGPASDVSCQEIVTRIVAELMADGIPVMALACSAAHPRCLPESGIHPFATVLVERRLSGHIVEVRAGDGLDGVDGSGAPPLGGDAVTARVRRLADGEADGAPAVLAIHAVELLKAMLLELEDAPASPPSPKGPVGQRMDSEGAHTVAKTLRPSSSVLPMGRHNLTIGLGAAVLGGFGGLRSAFGPSIRIGRRSSEHVLLSGALDGPAFGPQQFTATSSAKIRQEMLTLRADLLGLFWNAVVLRAGMGAGVYHVHVDGQGVLTDVAGPTAVRGGSASGFAGALSWSVGIVTNVRSDVGIFLDGSMFVLTPTPLISLGGQQVGRAGNPGVVLSAGAEARW